MTSTTTADIIDLTEDLSDLGCAPQGSDTIISSAKKRYRPSASQDLVDRDGVKRRPRESRARATYGNEKHYRSISHKGMDIEVDSMITYRTKSDTGQPSDAKGLVRRIVRRNDSEILIHVHQLCQSSCGMSNELFLRHGICQDIKRGTIQTVHPIRIGSRSPDPAEELPLVKHVFQQAYNVWRDPVLVVDGEPVCDACCSKKQNAKNEEYHLHDFVLVEEKTVNPQASSSLVWRVVQICEKLGGEGMVKVKLLERFSDFATKSKTSTNVYISQRRLLVVNEWRSISHNAILDKACVYDTPTEQQHDQVPYFFCRERVRSNGDIVPLSMPLSRCDICSQTDTNTEELYERFRRQFNPPAIDYYSGGGGGMIGAKGYFDHKHAVEMDEAACKTLRLNFPNTVVHEGLVSEASQAARSNNPRADNVPQLPQRGSMFLATAGPPCQGHTGANHQNKIADQRNDELFVAIAEIDRLRPDVFILENVPGMKRDRDEVDELSTTNFALQGIKALRAINYQVRLVQLDSRSFGSPQNRIRLFLICSRKGVLLPTIPKPSHANPVLRKNIFTAGSTRDFFVGEKGEVGSGPLPAVTVRDALSDLPEFEYQFHTPHSQAAQRNRAIKRFDPTQNPCGYRNPEPYRTPPGNDFQTQQRDGARRLQSHYTPHRSDRELQIIFSSDAFVGQTLPSDTPGNERRINPDRGAPTLLTSSAVGGKYTGPIHYNQRRTLTVAERKRIQGVPDRYKLYGRVEEKDRQIGNMINVNLSQALHAHIHREVFFTAWLEMGQPDDFLKRWREAHPV